ncbi:hypothetical protein D3C77_115610 [compost metagenome]
MSAIEVSVEVTPTPYGPRVDIKHRIYKRETEGLSEFQALGLMYHMSDAILQAHPRLIDFVADLVTEILTKDGWSKDTVSYLFSISKWDERMYAAWCLVGEEGREEAERINYKKYQNYWPTLDFFSPEWGVKAREWFEGHSYPVPTEVAQTLFGSNVRPSVLHWRNSNPATPPPASYALILPGRHADDGHPQG